MKEESKEERKLITDINQQIDKFLKDYPDSHSSMKKAVLGLKKNIQQIRKSLTLAIEEIEEVSTKVGEDMGKIFKKKTDKYGKNVQTLIMEGSLLLIMSNFIVDSIREEEWDNFIENFMTKLKKSSEVVKEAKEKK